jgi:hypothetical protein
MGLQNAVVKMKAEIDALLLETDNNVIRRKMEKLDFSAFVGNKATYTDRDGQKYPATILSGRGMFVVKGDIGSKKFDKSIRPVLNGLVVFNPSHKIPVDSLCEQFNRVGENESMFSLEEEERPSGLKRG